jgi:hypothetical protein
MVAVVAAASCGAAGAAQAAAGHARGAAVASDCATVKVKATPSLNTAMIPETIKTTVANCSTATETVLLTQTIKGPFVKQAPGSKTWTITLAAGQTVVKVRHVPYTCCGSYVVRDTVSTSAGQVLGTSKSSFTFA